MLDLTTADMRGIALERERVDVAGLCRAALETGRARAAEKSQKLEAEISPAAGYVFGDARRLRESVEHVLANALAYTDRKGRILLTADGDDENAVIRISDNGSGIAPEDMPRVFDRFDRVVEAGVRGEAALGLGLPLTRQFIEAHGGQVELEFEQGQRHSGDADHSSWLEMILDSEETTGKIGAALARAARAGDVITLSGPLGVGKTALARGFLAASGPRGRGAQPELRDRPAV